MVTAVPICQKNSTISLHWVRTSEGAVLWVQVLPHEGLAFPELPCSWSLAYMQGSQQSDIGAML